MNLFSRGFWKFGIKAEHRVQCIFTDRLSNAIKHFSLKSTYLHSEIQSDSSDNVKAEWVYKALLKSHLYVVRMALPTVS